MKTRLVLTACFVLVSLLTFAQSKTTRDLKEKYTDSRSLYAYKNTLRMYNIKEDKSLDELIDNIEKIMLLMIEKPANFNSAEYKKLVGLYKTDKFEEAMTSRFEGKSFDIMLKGKNNDIEGMLVLINDDKMLYILDIVGFIALDKVSGLYKLIEQSEGFTDILKEFDDDKGPKKKEDNNH
jgi:hypothetical protein